MPIVSGTMSLRGVPDCFPALLAFANVDLGKEIIFNLFVIYHRLGEKPQQKLQHEQNESYYMRNSKSATATSSIRLVLFSSLQYNLDD